MSEPVDDLPHGVTGPGLGLARRICEAARQHAASLGVAVSVAVVDAGSHLVSFDRMDTAEIAGPHLAVAKAATAVAHRCPSGDLAEEALPLGRWQVWAQVEADATSSSPVGCHCGHLTDAS